MAIRIKDIARDVNLPLSTVGNVLRDDPRYDKKIKERVFKSAQKLGYRPNILARGLKGGNTHTIGIVWFLAGPNPSVEMAQNIARKVQKHGYIANIADSLYKTETIKNILRDYIQRGVDAVVIQWSSSLPYEDFRDIFTNFKAVVLIPSFAVEGAQDQIVVNRNLAVAEVVDHFAKTGRKRPVIFAPAPQPRVEKISPFIDQLRKYGLPTEPDPVILYSYVSLNDLTDACWRTLEGYSFKDASFDALFCGTDEAAVVAYKWLATKGLRIPNDVAVVGFNDSMYSKYLTPSLASINRHDEEVTGAIEQMLFARLGNPDLPPQLMDLPMRFVWRESAG